MARSHWLNALRQRLASKTRRARTYRPNSPRPGFVETLENKTLLSATGAVLTITPSATPTEAAGTAAFTVTLSGTGTLDDDVMIDVASVVGTATGGGTDYADFSETITFNSGTDLDAGDATADRMVTLTNDAFLEADETFSVDLSSLVINGSGGADDVTLGGVTSFAVTIDDNESATLAVEATSSIAEESGAQNAGTVTLTITGSADSGTFQLGNGIAVTADITDATGGSATDTTDFGSVGTQTVTFDTNAATGATQSASVTPVNDQFLETNETINLLLDNLVAAGTDASLGNANNVTTIDDDEAATLDINATSTLAEGGGAQSSGVVTLTITGSGTGAGFQLGAGISLTADVTDATGGSATDTTDFGSVGTQTLTFDSNAATASTQSATLTPVDDQRVEGDETINLALGNLVAASTDASIGNAANVTTITDDDTASITFDAATSNPSEGGTSSTAGLTLTVTPNGAVGTPGLDVAVSVDVNETSATATEGALGSGDYEYTDTNIMFSPFNGTTTATDSVTITLHDDLDDGDPGNVVLDIQNLSSSLDGQVTVDAPSQHTVTIADNDEGDSATFNSPDDGNADAFSVVNNSGTLEVRTVPGDVLVASRTAASLATGLTINGAADENDVLTVDLSGGDAVPAGGITFNGGTGGNDSLVIDGGTTQGTTTYNYTNANDGDVAMSNFGTVTYTGLEPITNTGTADDIIFNLPNSVNHTVFLEDDGTDADAVSRLRSSTSSFEVTTFTHPTGSLTINDGDGDETIQISADFDSDGNATDFDASLTITADTGTDVLTVASALNLGDGTTNGNLSLTADTINLNDATIDIDNGTNPGDATFTGAVVLGTDVTIAANDVTFAGTINSDALGTPRSLTVNTTGTGVTTFTEDIGLGANAAFDGNTGDDRPLARIETNADGSTVIGDTVTPATITLNMNGASLQFDDAVVLSEDTIIQEAGAGNVTFNSTVDTADGLAAGQGDLTLNVNGGGSSSFNGRVGSDALGAVTQDGLGSGVGSAITILDGNVTFADSAAAGTDDVRVRGAIEVNDPADGALTVGGETGTRDTIVRLVNRTDSAVVSVLSNNVTIQDLTIEDGNGTAVGDGIVAATVSNLTVSNVLSQNNDRDGLNGTTLSGTTTIQNSDFLTNGRDGINLDTVAGTLTIFNVTSEMNQDDGFEGTNIGATVTVDSGSTDGVDDSSFTTNGQDGAGNGFSLMGTFPTLTMNNGDYNDNVGGHGIQLTGDGNNVATLTNVTATGNGIDGLNATTLNTLTVSGGNYDTNIDDGIDASTIGTLDITDAASADTNGDDGIFATGIGTLIVDGSSTAEMNTGDGLHGDNVADGVIENSTFSMNGENGIRFADVNSTEVTTNTIQNNGTSGTGDGVRVESGTDNPISQNVFGDNAGLAINLVGGTVELTSGVNSGATLNDKPSIITLVRTDTPGDMIAPSTSGASETIRVHGEFADEAAFNHMPGPFNIRIDGEILEVTAINPAGAGTELTVTRGVNNSPATTHNDGAVVEVLYDAVNPMLNADLDLTDEDAGANNLQNTPEILFAYPVYDGGGALTGVDIIYHVPSDTANSAYGSGLNIEFYVADSIRQEGATFIANDTYESFEALTPKTVRIPVSALTTASIDGLLAQGTAQASQVSLVGTATDDNGNTSEFSQSFVVMPMPGIETTQDPTQFSPGTIDEGQPMLPGELPKLNQVDEFTQLGSGSNAAFFATPGTIGTTVSLNYGYDTRGDNVSYADRSGITTRTQNNNEFGVYSVTDETGDVAGISPSSSSGYAAAAVGSGNRTVVRQRSSTTLTAQVAASTSGAVETITVTDAAALQDLSTQMTTLATGFEIVIEQEEMLVTGISGNDLTVQRGINGTTASVHPTNRRVEVLKGTQVATHDAGELLGFYLVNNAGANHLITANGIDGPTRSLAGNSMNDPRANKYEDRSAAFFSFQDANPDGEIHIRTELVRADDRPDVQPTDGVLTNDQINNGRDAIGGALDNGDFTGELIIYIDDDYGTDEFDLNFTDGNDAQIIISNPFTKPVSLQLEQSRFDADNGVLNLALGDSDTSVVVTENGGNLEVAVNAGPAITEFSLLGAGVSGQTGAVSAGSIQQIIIVGSSADSTVDLSGVLSAQFTSLVSTAISGRGGNDVVLGSEVVDSILGGDGNDTLTGGSGNDVIIGGNGMDSVDGEADNDTVAGGPGGAGGAADAGDTVVGETVNETIDLDAVFGDLLDLLEGTP
jgi:hypothetical protein